MSKILVYTSGAPEAIGPYSQAIRTGNLLYTAGQIALDPATGQLVHGGIKEQTTRVLENLKAIVEAAGSALANVVKTTVYLKNFDDFAAMNAVYASYLAGEGVVPPARTTIEASRLPKEALVEIEVVAEL
ncbi:MAG TPA: Rid family detoxifying hydrolase [Terracidiphilus sp.]|jgi:2-iminobutanoate/2-iminopropanoate deaminase|nr:Rid family detoxifying hydrolase [Terracidiphilus sp.]